MNKNHGFTLMELMVIIAILGILFAISIPNVISWRNNAQINSAARQVYSDIQYARSMAVKENMDCTISFEDGSYTIMLEHPIAGGPGGRTLKVINIADFGSVTLDSARFPDEDDGDNSITFKSTGFPFNSNNELIGGSVVLHGATNKRIVLSPAGDVRIENI